MDKFDREKFEEELKEMGIEYDPSAFKPGLLTKFLLRFRPQLGFKMLNKKLGGKNEIFDKFHDLFSKVETIDIFPTQGHRGFVIILDRNTALFFYQDGDHFKYDGFEMGEYAKGEVTIFDNLSKDRPGPYDL